MRKTKQFMTVLLTLATAGMMGGCGNEGISQEEYDQVVSERDALQEEYEKLLEKYSALYGEEQTENFKSESQESIEPQEEEAQKELEDFQENEPFFTYSGNGDDVVSNVETESTSYAHIIHEGDGHFSVKGYYGDTYDLLVNTTDPYNGITLIYPNEEYTFEVSASGDWTIELFKIGTSSIDSFSGNGDFVTPIFVKTSSVYEITTNGGGHFSVKGWDNNGYELLVNTTDENYSGKVMFDGEEECAFFEVTADREWEIKPVE